MAPVAINDPAEAVQSRVEELKAQQRQQAPQLATRTWHGPVPMSTKVAKIKNPIRQLLAGIDLGSTPKQGELKPLINLGLGDPSTFGNLPPPKEALDAIHASLDSGLANGYPASVGYADARQAIAQYFSEGNGGNFRPTENDIVLAHGCSGALEMALASLTSPDQNILLPKPLFTAYEAMVATIECEIRYYDLLPNEGWQVDFESVEKLIDDKTALLLINNPSNPCGSNWSESHLRDIASFCHRMCLPVISDEVYAGFAWAVSNPDPARPPTLVSRPVVEGKFNRGCFTSFTSVCGDLPVLTVGALSKRYLAPGLRVGWVMIHDPMNRFIQVRDGLNRLAFRIQGPSSNVQRALPAIFQNVPQSFYDDTLKTLQDVGQKLHARLSGIEGLQPYLSDGAMYLLCKGLRNFDVSQFIDDNEDPTDADTLDKAFITALHKEENVFILPGAAFRLEGGFIRFVTTVPEHILMQACSRLEAFCERHRIRA
ncbi:hypothetical protein OIO90_005342 [Microbotryomycetes sp. JL221]|nr:hypothetical protein OIO90_005342 [Microbotryomycetes sp. JL221]